MVKTGGKNDWVFAWNKRETAHVCSANYFQLNSISFFSTILDKLLNSMLVKNLGSSLLMINWHVKCNNLTRTLDYFNCALIYWSCNDGQKLFLLLFLFRGRQNKVCFINSWFVCYGDPYICRESVQGLSW